MADNGGHGGIFSRRHTQFGGPEGEGLSRAPCDWVCFAVLLCEKFSYFALRRVPGAVLAMLHGRAGRAWGALHEVAGKKSLTTGQARFPWAF